MAFILRLKFFFQKCVFSPWHNQNKFCFCLFGLSKTLIFIRCYEKIYRKWQLVKGWQSAQQHAKKKDFGESHNKKEKIKATNLTFAKIFFMRYKLTIDYDGSRYAGWQVQKGERTIQGAFFDACKKVFGETRFELFGSGRTDAGVHALGQVAHLEVEKKISTERLMLSLNDNLPYDINILSAEEANPKFHARYDAVERSYIYLISKRRTAFGKSNVWWVRDPLNVEFMQNAANAMKGKHDFSSFTDKKAETTSMLVNITGIDIHETNDLIAIHITGSHFLWKMVRRMVGVLVEFGRGNLTMVDMDTMLDAYSSVPAKLTAPAAGLYLERVYYKGERTVRGAQLVPQLLRLK